MSDKFKVGDYVKTDQQQFFMVKDIARHHSKIPDGFLVQISGDVKTYHNPENCSLYNGATSVLCQEK